MFWRNTRSWSAGLLFGAALLGGRLEAAPVPGPSDEDRPLRLEAPTRTINQLLARAWKAENLRPAGTVDDWEFLRRVTLDVVGRIPTREEMRAFDRDPGTDKRLRLVERLPRHDDHARHWANVWTDWLLPRTVHLTYRDQLNAWVRGQLERKVPYKEMVVRLLTATGKSDENGAVHFLLAHRGKAFAEDRKEADGQYRAEPATWQSARLFLGIQINCCTCHDHPFNPEVKQGDFWGLNAFFRQIEVSGQDVRAGLPSWPAPVLELRDNLSFNRKGVVSYTRRNGLVVQTRPTFLDKTPLAAEEKRPRRAVLAEWVTRHPNGSRVLVSRVWGQLMGRGLHEGSVVDDFGEHNPEVHPELLNRLVKAFDAGGQDQRQLIRWICTSDAYQLRCQPWVPHTAGNDMDKSLPEGEPYFSWMHHKPLSPEQRLDSLLTALRAQDTLRPGARERLRLSWLRANVTLETLNLDGGNCVRTMEVTPYLEPIRLMLSNQDVQDMLGHKAGTVARLLARHPPREMLDELYLIALNRYPTAREVAALEAAVGPGPLAGQRDPRVWQDVLWAPLSSTEFTDNH